MAAPTPPRLLPLTRGFLTFALALVAFAVFGGLGLFAAALVAPERLRTTTDALAGLSPDARAHMLQIAGAGLAIAAALLFSVLLQLRRLLDTAITGDPFRAENGRRLRRIAWLIFAMDVVTRTIGLGVGMAQFPRHSPFGFPLSFMGVVTVLMVLVLAHIFEYGTQLRSEVQGTV